MTRTLSKHWIQTASGVEFDLAAPRPEDVRIEDIARALSHICRFTGHVRSFYSVAQHSVLVSQACDPADALWGLLHDATEAYVNDIAAPLKSLLPDYSAVEERVQSIVAQTFGLELPIPPSVKRADLVLLATEARDLLPSHPWASKLGVEPLSAAIVPLAPSQARALFLDCYATLTGQRTSDGESPAKLPKATEGAASCEASHRHRFVAAQAQRDEAMHRDATEAALDELRRRGGEALVDQVLARTRRNTEARETDDGDGGGRRAAARSAQPIVALFDAATAAMQTLLDPDAGPQERAIVAQTLAAVLGLPWPPYLKVGAGGPSVPATTSSGGAAP